MSEIAEFWKEEKEAYKARCTKRNNKFEPILISIGAIKKSNAVYQLGDYFLYPTKGFAMHKKTYRKKNLEKFIKEHNVPNNN